MKAVMLSIHPKWVEKILNGEKTIEIRKNFPKVALPFKCHVYCTQTGRPLVYGQSSPCSEEKYQQTYNLSKAKADETFEVLNGKVVGEFVCEYITYIGNVATDKWENLQGDVHERHKSWVTHRAKLTEKECISYGGKYLWHISDFVIYEEPRALCEFQIVDKEQVSKCEFRKRTYTNPDITNNAYLPSSYVCTKGIREHEPEWCEQCRKKSLSRPPQSWCYVERERD